MPAAVLAILGVLLCVLPFRYFFIVIVLHLFTKDMNFRKDPSPIDRYLFFRMFAVLAFWLAYQIVWAAVFRKCRFYDAIPIREELDEYINNNEEQSFVLSNALKKPQT